MSYSNGSKKLMKQSDQVKSFVEAARQLGCDESEERFDAALGKIVKHKPLPDDKPTKPAEKKPGR